MHSAKSQTVIQFICLAYFTETFGVSTLYNINFFLYKEKIYISEVKKSFVTTPLPVC